MCETASSDIAALRTRSRATENVYLNVRHSWVGFSLRHHVESHPNTTGLASRGCELRSSVASEKRVCTIA
jgi:hypothetical protein